MSEQERDGGCCRSRSRSRGAGRGGVLPGGGGAGQEGGRGGAQETAEERRGRGELAAGAVRLRR